MPPVTKWDVVLINFPYTDGSATKRRPGVACALVLNDLGGEDVVVSAITSQPGSVGVQIAPTDAEFPQTGLHAASRILPGKLFTCAKSEVANVIGKLGPIKQGEVRDRLRSVLGL